MPRKKTSRLKLTELILGIMRHSPKNVWSAAEIWKWLDLYGVIDYADEASNFDIKRDTVTQTFRYLTRAGKLRPIGKKRARYALAGTLRDPATRRKLTDDFIREWKEKFIASEVQLFSSVAGEKQ